MTVRSSRWETDTVLNHPGCPFQSPTDVLALVSSIDRHEAQITLDPCQTQISEGDLSRWCKNYLSSIGYYVPLIHAPQRWVKRVSGRRKFPKCNCDAPL